MKTLSDNHIFEYEPDKYHLIFIDKTGAASGEYMKALKFRQPHIYKSLKDNLDNNDFNVGDVIEINNYIFVIGRKHYRSKWDLKSIKKSLHNSNFDYKILKSLSVDYSDKMVNTINDALCVDWRTEYKWKLWK